MTAGTLIVGASQAGVQLAVSLREAGHRGRITLVGAEAHPPYQRPPLSKAFLAGTADEASLELRTPEFYRRHGIDLVLGERVEQVTVADTGTGDGVAVTARGRRFGFDRLALTTGARPRRLDVPGAGADGVLYLRDVDDARRLRCRLRPGARVVVVGGGFIGLETAAAAATAGARVTVVEAADRVMSRAVAPVMSGFYAQAHRSRGIDLRLGCGVRAIRARDGRVAGVELGDGSVVPADAVVVGVGIVACTELARQLDLACPGGVLVDAGGRTSNPAVVAAGDCTVVAHPVAGMPPLRLESVPSAIAQARAAAATLAGTSVRADPVPWFWSDQYDLKLQMVGIADGHDQVVLRGDPEAERFSAIYYRAGRLVAVHAVNSPADYLAGRAALTRRAHIPPEVAADTSRSLKHVLVAAHRASGPPPETAGTGAVA